MCLRNIVGLRALVQSPHQCHRQCHRQGRGQLLQLLLRKILSVSLLANNSLLNRYMRVRIVGQIPSGDQILDYLKSSALFHLPPINVPRQSICTRAHHRFHLWLSIREIHLLRDNALQIRPLTPVSLPLKVNASALLHRQVKETWARCLY